MVNRIFICQNFLKVPQVNLRLFNPMKFHSNLMLFTFDRKNNTRNLSSKTTHNTGPHQNICQLIIIMNYYHSFCDLLILYSPRYLAQYTQRILNGRLDNAIHFQIQHGNTQNHLMLIIG